MNRADLITRVKIKLDEYTPQGVSIPFEDYIGPLLDESARDLCIRGPLHLLAPSDIPLTNVDYYNNKSYIPVPSDYAKLYEIKYPLWKKSVRVAITPENPIYKIQENEYLTSGYGRPVVAIVNTSIEGGTVIKYFECSKVVDPAPGTITPVALYVKIVLPEILNDQFADSLTWLCCGKMLGILGYGDKALAAMERFNDSFSALII